MTSRRRLTRAESAGLPAPSAEELREALATFRKYRDEGRLRRRRNELPGHDWFKEEMYYESAVQQVGGDLVCALVRDENDLAAAQALTDYEQELDAVRHERDEAIRAGFAYKGHRRELIERELAWERAISTLRSDFARERRVRGPSVAQRLGRGLRRFVVRD